MLRLCHEYAGIAGVDPGPMTLRELHWLAVGRYDVAAFQVASVAQMLGNGKSLDFKSINPLRRAEAEAELARGEGAEVRERMESRLAWRMLFAGARELSRERRG